MFFFLITDDHSLSDSHCSIHTCPVRHTPQRCTSIDRMANTHPPPYGSHRSMFAFGVHRNLAARDIHHKHSLNKNRSSPKQGILHRTQGLTHRTTQRIHHDRNSHLMLTEHTVVRSFTVVDDFGFVFHQLGHTVIHSKQTQPPRG